ncbi:MAG: hypothetical protein QOF54_895 [Solirubrobacteraceae bacterium]|jgi:hypothetical protein|nr:hypothetical protein [Solirubrobacteraceae bacterium]
MTRVRRRSALLVALLLLSVAPAQARAKTPQPVTGKVAVIQTMKGSVTVNGRPLGKKKRAVKMGATIDTTRGTVKIITTHGGGKTQYGTFSEGAFVLTQTRGSKPLTDLKLTGGDLSACPATAGGRIVGPTAAKRARRRLFGHAHGRFRTRGRSSSATVRGTKWVTEDTCAGTRTEDRQGEVLAQSDSLTYDLKHGQTVQILCDPNGQPPVSSLFCLAVLSEPASNVYGFGISTQSPDSSSYDLCITNPDGTQQCNTHPFDPADSQGFRSAGVGCVPGGGPGTYAAQWRIGDTFLAAPMTFVSTQPKDPSPFCVDGSGG